MRKGSLSHKEGKNFPDSGNSMCKGRGVNGRVGLGKESSCSRAGAEGAWGQQVTFER